MFGSGQGNHRRKARHVVSFEAQLWYPPHLNMVRALQVPLHSVDQQQHQLVVSVQEQITGQVPDPGNDNGEEGRKEGHLLEYQVSLLFQPKSITPKVNLASKIHGNQEKENTCQSLTW